MLTSVRLLRSHLLERVQRGEHLILYGPRGSGKSRLVGQLQELLSKADTPCGVSPATSRLNDITRALELAYPQAAGTARTRRGMRSRLWLAADERRGALLLDHVSALSTAMLGFLRRLRGGVAGVLLVVDFDIERDRRHVRALHVGMLSVRMPRTDARALRQLLRSACTDTRVTLDGPVQAQIVRAARGRPGWINRCAALITQGRYWRDDRLLVNVLCTDTEISLRQGPPGTLVSGARHASGAYRITSTAQ